MKDKIYLVTGSAKGIGKAIAKELISSGAQVIICDQDPLTPEFVTQEFGEKATFFQADISNKNNLEELKTKIQTKFGRLDGLVANAGIMPLPCGIKDITDENMDKTINVNLKGTFFTLKILGSLVSEAGKDGSIVTLTSVDGLIGEPYGAIYSATKAGIISLTKSFARHYANPLVRVNAIAPGLIDTPMSSSTGEDPSWTTDVSVIKRIGQPEEIAHMATFLLSDRASYITGQVFTVDGGFTLK